MQRVSYTDPANAIPKISTDLQRQFPLKNLHWSPGDRPLRTIPSLDIKLVPQDNKTQHQILGLSDVPLVQIYLIQADSYDQFKSQRKQISEWARNVQNIRDPTGYLIVHFVDANKHRSKSIWAKLSADYGDHAAQIYLDDSQPEERQEMWLRFSQALKIEVLSAFSARVHAFEGEIRNLQSTRDIVGWNFGRLIVIKESLATCLEDMGFLEDAYQLYLEIERMAEPDFFSGSTKADVSVHIKRDYILDAMLTQTASIFDFYAYLFQREVALLVQLGSASELPSVKDKYLGTAVQRAITWIPKLVHMLRATEASSTQVLDWQMQQANYVYTIVGEHTSNTVADSRGQLLLLERDALCSLAAAKGYFIPGLSVDVPLDTQEGETGSEKAPDEKVGTVVASQQDFEERWLEITNHAIKDFETAGMKNSTTTLKVQLANIDLAKGEHQRAFDTLTELQAFYANSKWPSLAAEVYDLYLRCAQLLGHNDKVLEAAWSLLELQPALSHELSEKCVDLISTHSQVVETTHDATKWLDINVVPYLCGDSRYYLNVKITPRYKKLPFLQLKRGVIQGICEKQGTQKHVAFVCTDLKSGKFYTNQFFEDTLELKELVLQLGDQKLVKKLQKNVRMFQLSSCFNAQLKLANSFTLTKRNLELHISSPVPTTARVKLLAVDGLQILQEKLESSSLESFTSATITVPALVRHEVPLARVQVVIEYGKNCRFEFIKQVDMSIAVLVHVQEFFREQVILNQFLVSCTTTMPVIVDHASLERSKLFEVLEQEPSEAYVVLDGAPVSLVYLLKPDDQRQTGKDELTLNLNYRSAQVELDNIIWSKVEPTLGGDLSQYSIILKDALQDIPVDSISYVIQSRFRIDPVHIDHMMESLAYIEPHTRTKLSELLHSTLTDCDLFRGDKNYSHLNSCMQLASPEPKIDVVHFVNIEYDRGKEYSVGDVINATLSIKCITKWAAKPIESPCFYYELDKFSCEGWSFHGPARAKFSDELSTEISLIPTRAGVLELALVEIFCEQQLNMEVVQRQKGETIRIIGPNELIFKF